MTVPESTTMKCEQCGKATRSDEVNLTIWLGSELNLVENVPAHVCDHCDMQYFDAPVEQAVRELTAEGFPGYRTVRYVNVPVFNLAVPSPSTAPATQSKMKVA